MEKVERLLTENLNSYLKRKNWDALKLSEETGITRSGIYKILKGERWPNADNLSRIAKALGVSVSNLFGPPSAVTPTPIEAWELVGKALQAVGKNPLSDLPLEDGDIEKLRAAFRISPRNMREAVLESAEGVLATIKKPKSRGTSTG